MQPPNQNIPIESLPRDVLSFISKVASSSREDVFSCKELGADTDDGQVFRSMNLSDVVIQSLLALNACSEVMTKCLAHENPSAHYVAGLLDYFHPNNPVKGLNPFHVAANAPSPVKEVVYLYGVIKLCTREFEEGRNYLDMLGSHGDDVNNAKCWTNIKRSLHGLGNVERPEYMPSLLAMLPAQECNVYDMDNACPHCYQYYKKMFKFVFTI